MSYIFAWSLDWSEMILKSFPERVIQSPNCTQDSSSLMSYRLRVMPFSLSLRWRSLSKSSPRMQMNACTTIF